MTNAIQTLTSNLENLNVCDAINTGTAHVRKLTSVCGGHHYYRITTAAGESRVVMGARRAAEQTLGC